MTPTAVPRRAPLRGAFLLLLVVQSSCRSTPPAPGRTPSFDEDVAFLREHVEVVLLSAPDGPARVAVVPAWQGRVVTSTGGGAGGRSHGWVNRELIASGEVLAHMNPYGGEDRLWLGPEGGPFALFFGPGVPFELEHWQVPALIDTEPFPLVERGPTHVAFRREASLVNRAGTRFELRLERAVRLLGRAAAEELLGVGLGELTFVGFESRNVLVHAGGAPWTREGGLVSLWVLGMFPATPGATVVLPVEQGPGLGPLVGDDYFGPVPPERLAVSEGHVLFRGDGLRRGKIGVGPRRARPVLGSWAPERGTLTLVHFDLPSAARKGELAYVDSTWREQADPFGGDAVNAYNDEGRGPGSFYELETSSPAAELGPGESLSHVHRTFHLEGPRRELDRVARAVLGLSLDAIERALPERGS